MPTSNACDVQGGRQRRGGAPLTLQDLRDVLADQHIVVPVDRMDLVFQEFILLQRQRALINGIVERNDLAVIHTVISRAAGAI